MTSLGAWQKWAKVPQWDFPLYLAFRHRQMNANLRSRGKWRQNACVCVCEGKVSPADISETVHPRAKLTAKSNRSVRDSPHL
jgi:hypothetical protein